LFAGSLAAIIVIPTLLKLGQPLLASIAAGAGVAIASGFVWWELRAKAPVVDVRLFARPHFAATCASVGLSNLVMYTTLLALPLYLERVRGHSVQVAGFTLAALSAFSALWGPIGGRWRDRSGGWLPAVSGAVALLAGTLLLTIGVRGTGLGLVIVALALMGLGLGVSGASVQTAAVEAVPEEKTGSAAGIFSTARYLGSVVGSSVLAIAFAQRPNAGQADRFVVLFAGLAVVALAGIAVHARVADRHATGT
ncbi:MAG: MFS transporter, partial [Chloroflexota bacterium]|nr:MFS transporter [Chloroflexota bacterium]